LNKIQSQGGNMKRQAIILFVMLILLSGCTIPTYKGGIEPIYPGVRSVGKSYETVDSLTPTFRWKATEAASCTYDFSIWDAGDVVADGPYGMRLLRGPALYYKEALPKPEHTVELPLGPDSRYYWSARLRCNGKVSEWATYDYSQWAGIAASEGKNWPFGFKTPKIDAK
jgi:hypothetical protein